MVSSYCTNSLTHMCACSKLCTSVINTLSTVTDTSWVTAVKLQGFNKWTHACLASLYVIESTTPILYCRLFNSTRVLSPSASLYVDDFYKTDLAYKEAYIINLEAFLINWIHNTNIYHSKSTHCMGICGWGRKVMTDHSQYIMFVNSLCSTH